MGRGRLAWLARRPNRLTRLQFRGAATVTGRRMVESEIPSLVRHGGLHCISGAVRG